MSREDTLLELPESREIFKTLFGIAYHTKEPILPLRQIMHWQTVREKLSVPPSGLDDAQTLVFGGYFYNFSTPALAEDYIEACLKVGAERGVSQFLIPTVRDDIDGEALERHGFAKIPWFVESIFDIDSDVDTDLLRRVGSKRSRELIRTSAKANEAYSYEWANNETLNKNTGLIQKIAELHSQNIEKYRHTVNLYPFDVLAAILQSPLASNLVILCRRERTTETLVQVAICMRDDQRKHLYVLVQGKDYAHDSGGLNLYNSLFYEFYHYAARSGLKTIYLGRGNHDLKKRLGANRFRVLNNWILTKDLSSQNQLSQIVREVRVALRLSEVGVAHDRK